MKTTEDRIPFEFHGNFGFWSVRETIRSDLSPGSPELGSIRGVWGGFNSEDADEWKRVLPTLRNIRYLVSWTGFNTQPLVDSVLKMLWLERLCFGNLRAADLSALRNLSRLDYLGIHQLGGAKDLSPLARLRSLRVLEIGLNDKVVNFDWLEGDGLKSLQSLIVYGNRSTFTVPGFQSLTELKCLQYISLPTIKPAELSLQPFLSLPDLKVLHVRNESWPTSEVEGLRSKGVHLIIGPPLSR